VRLVDEYRDPALVHALAARIAARATRRWTVMEVCGGQTHAILAHGLDALVEESVTLLHGPGCPVCVTPLATLDHAFRIATGSDAILCSFGDMLREQGGDIRVVYAPLDAARLAARTPDRPVVFLAVGFGAFASSWMNDSGFWVVNRLSGMTETETLRSWTVMLTIVSVFGLLLTLVASKVFPMAPV